MYLLPNIVLGLGPDKSNECFAMVAMGYDEMFVSCKCCLIISKDQVCQTVYCIFVFTSISLWHNIRINKSSYLVSVVKLNREMRCSYIIF